MSERNIDHVRDLSIDDMAELLHDFSQYECLYCDRERRRCCNGKCVDGIRVWLKKIYSRSDPTWQR